MPFKKGQSGNPKGKPKGARTKISESFWQDWLSVYNEIGGAETLKDFALACKRNMETFLGWGAKTIPTNVQANLSGKVDGDHKLVIEVVQTK